MILLPVRTRLIEQGEDLASILRSSGDIQPGDILAISSKVIAMSEGAAIDLSKLEVSSEAKMWSEKTKRSPSYCQAVLNETARMHGTILGSATGAILTELQPDGFREGSILIPNAGLDESNIENDFAIGWPLDPVSAAKKLFDALDRKIGIIITDSCCHPRRLGVTAFALAVAGFDPLKSEIGSKDLFGKTLHMTHEAIADQLATATNLLMGNAAQSVPAVIIRDHNIPMTKFSGWVPGIAKNEDLFRDLF